MENISRMRKILILSTLVIGAALTGCGEKKPKELSIDKKISQAAEEAIKLKLKDPESAQFRNVYVKKIPTENNVHVMCGELNAKNSMGGYVGFKPFLVFVTTKENNATAGGVYLNDNDCSKKYPR